MSGGIASRESGRERVGGNSWAGTAESHVAMWPPRWEGGVRLARRDVAREDALFESHAGLQATVA